jgi:AraC-like DNA-binding protein
VQQGAVDSLLDSGSAWFMHADVPGAGVTEGTHVLAINLPSKALRRAVGHNRHLAPVALARGDPIIQLVTGYIESTKQLPADADPALLSSIGKHLTDLVGLALGPTRDAAEQAEKGGVKAARLDAVLRAIDSNYTDPEFSVAGVATQLKLSVRYVQNILQETGIGFAERVLELRLQHACDLLSRAHMTNRKVSDIAFSCGFNNLSYFHRAFRRRFGMTPAGARPS